MAAAVIERICRYSDLFVVARLRSDNMNWKLMLLVAALALQLVNLPAARALLAASALQTLACTSRSRGYLVT